MIRPAVMVLALVMGGILPAQARMLPQVTGVSARASQLESQLLSQPTATALYLALAAEYESRGHPQHAEATLRLGLSRAQEPARVRATLVDLLARLQRWTDAIETGEPLARDSVGRAAMARLRVNAGLAEYRAGNGAAARAQWERALVADPSLVEAAVNLGALLLEVGARDSARAVASRTLAFHPDHPRLLTLRAATIDGPEGLPAAVAALRRLRAQQPADERLGLELASLLVATGDRLAAAALYDTLLRAPKASEAAHRAAALLWLDGGQMNAAVALLEKGLEHYPRSGTLMALLGEAEAGRNEWRKAAAAYRRAAPRLARAEDAELPLLDVLIAASDTAEAVALIGMLAARPAPREVLLQVAPRAVSLGQSVMADSIYRGLLARDSLDLVALEAAAALAEAARDTVRAIALYRRAMTRDSAGPIAPLALLRLAPPAADSARLWLRRGVWRGMDALQALELQNAANAGGPLTARSVARTRPLLDRQRHVRELLRSALDTMVLRTSWGPKELQQLRLAYPRSALLERYATALDARDGNVEAALASYDRLLRRNAADAESQRARARLLERMGRLPDAIGGYTKALDLEPEDESTFRTLQRLREAAGSLDELWQQIHRLRVRLPDSRALCEHEIEVLQRLGRFAEAQEAARQLKAMKQ